MAWTLLFPWEFLICIESGEEVIALEALRFGFCREAWWRNGPVCAGKILTTFSMYNQLFSARVCMRLMRFFFLLLSRSSVAFDPNSAADRFETHTV